VQTIRAPTLGYRSPLGVYPSLPCSRSLTKVAKCLPPWKGRMLNRSGRLVLAQSTLYTILVHISMATKIAPWAIQAIENLVRVFLWCCSEVAVGGKCVVAWVTAAYQSSTVALAFRTYYSWVLHYDCAGCGWPVWMLTKLGWGTLFGLTRHRKSF
jgi:hypothetical protein